MQQFSDRLKQAMEEHGYKQVDLIRLVNETGSPRGIHVGKSHISQYCSGENDSPGRYPACPGTGS